ncbi:hypothetical protein MAMC_00997 [Methylacidimicrobium cyclopophantes]|uniref:Uncharacterized protein n=1 Tax=Methylacidimicrobium cyclopophantes TaxID=1041766 RepID=A0A5E6MD63_9BACT|nr:hypothetical protein [Methylacidimicrobium cyclopophantes]VVM06221.1 hypothetical protein MAMC_00997 [Methylacidimicrobium cyclopophantes]
MKRSASLGIALLVAAVAASLWRAPHAGAQYPVTVTSFTGQAGLLMQQIQQGIACIQQTNQQIQQQTLLLQQMEQGTKKSAAQLANLNQLKGYEAQLNQSPLAAMNLLGAMGGPLGMAFNGAGLVGAGLGYIGNLMGLSGMPLGMSWMPPFLLTGLNAAQLGAAQLLGNQFLGSGSPTLGAMLGNLGTMATAFAPMFLGGSNPLAMMGVGALGNLASLATMGASGGLNGLALPATLSGVLPSLLGGALMLGNGAFVRPSNPTDPAYQTAIWQGSGPQQAAFWITQAGLPNGSSTTSGLYHPITGPNANAAYGMSPVAPDIFTNGAWGAVQRYQINQSQNSGGSGTGIANPLDSYAQQNLPAIQAALLTTPPGEPVIPRSTSAYGVLPADIAIVPVQFGGGSLAGAAGTLVTGIGAAILQTFLGQMAANLQRIQQNYASEQINRQLYQHTQSVIATLQGLQSAAQGLAASFQGNPNLPIAQLAQFRMLVNSEINAKHQHLNTLQQQIEHHRQTRYGLLQEHEHIRQAMRQRTILDGGGSASALLNQINGRVNAGSNGA